MFDQITQKEREMLELSARIRYLIMYAEKLRRTIRDDMGGDPIAIEIKHVAIVAGVVLLVSPYGRGIIASLYSRIRSKICGSVALESPVNSIE